jgi:hypothetical protein
MKIIDCFFLNDELDLLELRLREHYNHVDLFIISEAPLTITGKPKPMYLGSEWDRFKPWADKIYHLECTSLYPEDKVGHDKGHMPWDNELHLRESLMMMVKEQDDDDLILHSDVHEIYRAGTLQALRAHGPQEYGFLMPQFRFKMNNMQLQPAPTWVSGGCAMPKRHLTSMNNFRKARHLLASGRNSNPVIAHAGWCFKDMCTDQELKQKFDIDAKELAKPGFRLHNKSDAVFKPVQVDDYFPGMIRYDDRWNKYLLDGNFDVALASVATEKETEQAEQA